MQQKIQRRARAARKRNAMNREIDGKTRKETNVARPMILPQLIQMTVAPTGAFRQSCVNFFQIYFGFL